MIRSGLFVLMSLLCGFAPAQDDGGASGSSQYIEMQPPFVANYGGPGKMRYLKAEVALRVAPDGTSAVRRHMPWLRHVLVMLFSRQTGADLGTVEGREALRQQALEDVRAVLVAEEGEQHVLDLLFNSFIVQS